MKFLLLAVLTLFLSVQAHATSQVCHISTVHDKVATYCTNKSLNKVFYQTDDFDRKFGEAIVTAKARAAQFLINRGFTPYGDGSQFLKK